MIERIHAGEREGREPGPGQQAELRRPASLMMSTAAAPSPIGGAVAGRDLPSDWNAGFSVARTSTV